MFLWLMRKIHPTWLFTVFCAGVVMGVSAAFVWRELYGIAWLCLASVLTAISFVIARRWVTVIVLCAGLLLGLWRGGVGQESLAIYASRIGETVQLTGKVTEDTDKDKKGRLIVKISEIHAKSGKSLPGTIWLTTHDTRTIMRSDELTIEGRLGEGFGSYPVSIYDAKVVEIKRTVHGDLAREVRDDFAMNVRRVVHEPMASLGIGYLVGQRRDLPEQFEQALRIAGLTHIVVASGYNLTILVRIAKRLFEKISQYLATLSSGLMIGGFMLITGFSPSMSRAGLVAGLSLMAWYYGRKFHPVTLLLLAAATTVLINPSYAWGDLGWQLSFAAFAGVMLISPIAQSYFFGDTKPTFVRQILGETIAAQLATAPIIIAAFGQLSIVALLSNLLILPLVPLAMLLTFVSGIGGWLGWGVLGVPAEWLLGYMVHIATWTASLPGAQIEIHLSTVGVVVSYIVIVAVMVYLWKASGYRLRDVNIIT